jgi:hypothetical protein
MPELGAALGRAFDLGVDLIDGSHAHKNDLTMRDIP